MVAETRAASSQINSSARNASLAAASADDVPYWQPSAGNRAPTTQPAPAPSHRRTDRSRGRQHFGASPSFSQIVRQLLQDVRRDTDTLAPDIFTSNHDAAPNASGLRCIETSMVRVPLGTGSDTRLHAAHINQIDFNRDANKHRSTDVFRAGQSPAAASANVGAGADLASAPATLSQACEKALMEGITSRLGIYQVVSRKAHHQPDESKETPILHILQRLWASRQPNDPPLLFGGRYRVTGLEVQTPEAPDHRHGLLTVVDTTLGVDDASRVHIIPLTQAGLKFTGKLLDTPEIATANAVLDAHRKLIPQQIRRAARQAEPTIYSHAGIGRNATLITYRRIARLIRHNKIRDENTLAAVLRNTINIERKQCGKKFLHSEPQINALWLALSARLAKHREENPVDVQPDGGGGDVADDENAQGPVVTIPKFTVPINTSNEYENRPKSEPITAQAEKLHVTADRLPDFDKPINAASECDRKFEIKAPAIFSAATAVPHPSVASRSDVPQLNSTANRPDNEVTSTAKRVLHAAAETTAEFSTPINVAARFTSQVVPDLIPIRHPSVRAFATGPFELLEQPDNPQHANWLAAARLIQQCDAEKYQRFVAAFDAQVDSDPNRKPDDPPEKGLVKHLSDFQLTALEKYLNPSKNPTKKAQPREEEDEEKKANALAIRRALNGEDVDSGAAVRDPEAISRAFGEEYFDTLSNAGSGNCLFHALCGHRGHENLSKSELAEVRCQIALVRLNRPDTEREMELNWHQIYEVLPDPERLRTSFVENGIPLAITNSKIAAMQTRSGYTAGDLEIQDWIDIPGNNTESVIVINGQIGLEAITRFDRQTGRHSARLTTRPNFENLSPKDVRDWIETELADAMNDRNVKSGSTSPRVLVLYQSTGHWERIVGLKEWSLPNQSLGTELMQGVKKLAQLLTTR